MKFFTRMRMREFGITPQDCEDVAQSASKETAIMRVYGTVSKMEKGTSNLGEFTRFIGEFEGVNILTGDKARSTKLILPAPGETLLRGLVSTGKKKNGEESSVVFGLDCTVRPHSTNGQYEKGWQFKHGVAILSDGEIDDPLTALGKQFGEITLLGAYAPEKALTNPKKSAKK